MATRAYPYRTRLAAVAATVEQRGAQRWPAQVRRVLGDGAQEPAAAELVDVSLYGCRVAVAGELAGPVLLTLAGHPPVAAQVVWAEDGVVGCRFDVPLPRTLLRALTIRAV